MDRNRFRKFAVLLSGLCLSAFLCLPAMAAEALKITVYGGDGRIGQRIVTEALNRGHTVTVVSRNPKVEKRDRLTAVKGDILDSADVAQKMSGQDMVIASVNSRDTEFFRRAAESLASAARKQSKPPRILWVGGGSTLLVAPGKTLRDSMPAPAAPMGAYLGQQQVLDYFRTLNDVAWTYATPSQRIEPGKRTGKFRVGKDELLKDDKGVSQISMEDFAMAVIDEAEQGQYVRARFTVGY